jgi:hypothetical protein
VQPPNGTSFTRGLEPFGGIFADWLEHSIPRLIFVDCGQHQGLVDQGCQVMEYRLAWHVDAEPTNSAASSVWPPANTDRRRKRACSTRVSNP